MAEVDGGGRLDRIEGLLERTGQRINQVTELFNAMVDHHDHEFKQLLTWQVLMQDKMDRWEKTWERSMEEAALERKRLDTLYETTDKRIADLVAAIAKLLAEKSPPANL
jgi:hypothetical protein